MELLGGCPVLENIRIAEMKNAVFDAAALAPRRATRLKPVAKPPECPVRKRSDGRTCPHFSGRGG